MAAKCGNPLDNEIREITAECQYSSRLMQGLQNIKRQYSSLQIETMKDKIDKIMSATSIALDNKKLVETFDGLTSILSKELEIIKVKPINKSLENLIPVLESKKFSSDIFWHIEHAVQNQANEAPVSHSHQQPPNLSSKMDQFNNVANSIAHNFNVATPVQSTSTYNTYQQPQVPVQTPAVQANQLTPVASVREQTPYISTTPQQVIYNGVHSVLTKTYSQQGGQSSMSVSTPMREVEKSQERVQARVPEKSQERTNGSQTKATSESQRPTLPLTPSPSIAGMKPVQHAMAMQILAAANKNNPKSVTIHSTRGLSQANDQPVPETATSITSMSPLNPNFSQAVKMLAEISASQTTFGDHVSTYSPNFEHQWENTHKSPITLESMPSRTYQKHV